MPGLLAEAFPGLCGMGAFPQSSELAYNDASGSHPVKKIVPRLSKARRSLVTLYRLTNLFTYHCLHCEYAWQQGDIITSTAFHLVNKVE